MAYLKESTEDVFHFAVGECVPVVAAVVACVVLHINPLTPWAWVGLVLAGFATWVLEEAEDRLAVLRLIVSFWHKVACTSNIYRRVHNISQFRDKVSDNSATCDGHVVCGRRPAQQERDVGTEFVRVALAPVVVVPLAIPMIGAPDNVRVLQEGRVLQDLVDGPNLLVDKRDACVVCAPRNSRVHGRHEPTPAGTSCE